MKKRKSKRTIRKQKINKIKLIFFICLIVAVVIGIYNGIKSDKKTAETVNYNSADKIDKCIVIDAGHGGEEEPGCIFNNIYEKTICLQIAEKLQEKLEKEYSRVIMTRTEDVNVYLNERARIANREDADIFISIHQNALENDVVTSGIETWYNPVKDTQSKILAKNIQENIIKTTNAKDLGIKESEGLIVTKNTLMPSCLVETGFLSSTEERKKLISSEYQDKIVEGIYNGIKSYFNSVENSENNDVNGNDNNNINANNV